MSSQTSNRYAVFSSEEIETARLTINDTIDIDRNLVDDQIEDDSIPWQEVKKSGAPPVLPPRRSAATTLAIRDYNQPIPSRTTIKKTRSHTISASTVENNDKTHGFPENWCGICSQKFTTKAALLTHIKLSPEHQHYCNLCKRVFKDLNGLKNHVENAWDHDIFCNLCLSAFKDAWGLKNHFQNNLHVGHEFACLICLLGFESQVELDDHLRTAEKHTWCQSCHRRFDNQDERDDHWQTTKSMCTIHLFMWPTKSVLYNLLSDTDFA